MVLNGHIDLDKFIWYYLATDLNVSFTQGLFNNSHPGSSQLGYIGSIYIKLIATGLDQYFNQGLLNRSFSGFNDNLQDEDISHFCGWQNLFLDKGKTVSVLFGTKKIYFY